MTDKKKIELQVLMLFRKLYGEFPNGKIVQNESPDFLVKVNRRKKLGIELTELHGQEFYEQQGHLTEPEKINEHIEDTIRAKEEKIYLYQKHKPFQLWLLIHIESFQNKLLFNFQNKIGNWNFPSDFDRIFLMEIENEKLFEIN
ncbi:hypothetical protein ACUNWD_05660 [Sunxiuqinia sp. A32]|uniref:hypothetical protein n=1 Tax=Sunxiuqinia sp. A32 TaxID=3461496 RepID=UPI0040462E7D